MMMTSVRSIALVFGVLMTNQPEGSWQWWIGLVALGFFAGLIPTYRRVQ